MSLRARQLLIAACVMLLATTTLAATRTLTEAVDAREIERVKIDAAVGSVEILVAEAEEIDIEVVLKPRRGGIFTSMRKAQRQVDEARLTARVSRGSLRLEIDTGSDDHRFEERWTVHMPAHLELDLELGVGDVEIRDLIGGIEMELGVGDALLRIDGGDLDLAVGVGDVSVKAPASGYQEATCSSGVGDTRLIVNGRTIDSDGLVGHSAHWDGEGDCSILVEVGVGDSRVTLE